MRCTTAQKLISQRSDGELASHAHADLTTHLDRCPACRAFAAEVAGLHAALAAWPAAEPRPDFAERFACRLAETPQRPSVVWSWGELLRPARVAAAGAALAAGVALAILAQDAPPALEAPPARTIVDTFEALPADSAAARYLAVLPAGGLD